jgi:hypothetical protein
LQLSDFSDPCVRFVFMRLSRPPPVKVLGVQALQRLQSARNVAN